MARYHFVSACPAGVSGGMTPSGRLNMLMVRSRTTSMSGGTQPAPAPPWPLLPEPTKLPPPEPFCVEPLFPEPPEPEPPDVLKTVVLDSPLVAEHAATAAIVKSKLNPKPSAAFVMMYD